MSQRVANSMHDECAARSNDRTDMEDDLLKKPVKLVSMHSIQRRISCILEIRSSRPFLFLYQLCTNVKMKFICLRAAGGGGVVGVEHNQRLIFLRVLGDTNNQKF